MRSVEHPFIKAGKIEFREYQHNLSKICLEENTLLVLPTGLGKTVVALLVVAEYLRQNPVGKCLVLAPTRPLTDQHYRFLVDTLNIDHEQISSITGEDHIDVRRSRWLKKVICATPQVTYNDIERGLLNSEDISLVIYDEAHRAVGNYAYCSIGSLLTAGNPHIRAVGMTASLPSEEDKVKEVLTRLGLKRVEVRDERSEEVKRYIQRTGVEWIRLHLPPIMNKIRNEIRTSLTSHLKILEQSGLVKRNSWGEVGLKALLDARSKVEPLRNFELKKTLFSSIRLTHALNLLETQGVNSFLKFFDRLAGRGFSAKALFEDAHVKEAYETARGASLVGIEHPKIIELERILRSLKEGERAIVFVSYRDSVENLCQRLASKGFSVDHLVGRSGQTQAKQLKTLERFRSGIFKILVATQVGEEGLDVSECSLVVFYDNVPSAIRFVQRRGRTGRKAPGRVVILLAEDTKDEAYYWLSRRRIDKTKNILKAFELKQSKKGPLDEYLLNEDSPLIYVDGRETGSITDFLTKMGIRVDIQTLDVGDYVLSSDVIVERKTIEDFTRSVIDGRLFKQLVSMRETYSKPIIIIQGSKRLAAGIGESAFFGALASIVIDFQIPVFISEGDEETAKLLYHIAKREQVGRKKEIKIREGRKPDNIKDIQRYIVAGIPGVSSILADRLLEKFETIEEFFSAKEEELRKVEGIGEKLAKRIRKLSTAQYRSEAST